MYWYVLYVLYITDVSRLLADIDECTAGTDECGDNSDCINTLGSYMCRCNTGFKLGSSNFECEGKVPTNI